MRFDRLVKYEEELDSGFAGRVAQEPGGEQLWDCVQCGTCSAICPVSVYMDLTPRRIVGMVRAGFRDEVLNATSPWICTSCYSCTVECPEGIRITDIMYIVKRMAMKESRQHRIAIPAIEEAFITMVRKHGRLTEGRMGVTLAAKSGVRYALGMLPIAWRLMRKGRIHFLRMEHMENPESLRAVLAAVEQTRSGPARRRRSVPAKAVKA